MEFEYSQWLDEEELNDLLTIMTNLQAGYIIFPITAAFVMQAMNCETPDFLSDTSIREYLPNQVNKQSSSYDACLNVSTSLDHYWNSRQQFAKV